MSNKNYKKPQKVKSSIKQYLIVAAICLPFLIAVSLLCEIKWKISRVLTIFIMCCIILLAWLIWIALRIKIEKRNRKFAKERKENRQKN